MRLILVICYALLGRGDAAVQEGPHFEVASLKETAHDAPPHAVRDPTTVIRDNVPLAHLVGAAFGVRTYQMIGPGWIFSQRVSMAARLPSGDHTAIEINKMVQQLLEERYHLKVHRENKLHSVYVLEASKKGTNLKLAVSGASPIWHTELSEGMAWRHMCKAATLNSLAGRLGDLLMWPTVDETGIQGDYELTFAISQGDLSNLARAYATSGAQGPEGGPVPSLTSSLDSLGLVLEPRKALVEFLVVDSISRHPTEN